MNLLREYIRVLVEATEYDSHFKPLMDSGFDGIKQAMELADSLGITSQELPWDMGSIDEYAWEMRDDVPWPEVLEPTGWTEKDYRNAFDAKWKSIPGAQPHWDLTEQKVLAQGMCFPFAIEKAEEWFEDHFTKGGPGRKPKRHPDLNNMDKFKVVHGKVTDKWEKPPKPIVHAWVEMGDLVFDDQTKHTKPDGIPKDVYYDMYQPEVVEEFTAEKALMKCMWEGGEGPWNDDLYAQMQDRDAWMKESRVREYVRALLKEDPMGFVHDLAAASSEFGEEGETFFGGDPGKGGGKAIKRAFSANADHQWLSTLDTVHWTGEIYDMEALAGKGKDELSTTMTLSGENFDGLMDYGLWVKGRITLATNDMDQLYSGHWEDYIPGLTSTVSEKEYEQRKKSSGINKLPTTSKDYSRYGKLKRGSEFGEKMARNIPYVLDQSTWDNNVPGTNEALVDNWSPVGIILTRGDEINAISGLDYIEGTKEDIEEFALGVTKQIMLTALAFGVPIYDEEREVLWSPE